MSDSYPVLQTRRGAGAPSLDQNVDQVRRILWRAYQRGAMTEDEFASTLDRLDFGPANSESVPQAMARR